MHNRIITPIGPSIAYIDAGDGSFSLIDAEDSCTAGSLIGTSRCLQGRTREHSYIGVHVKRQLVFLHRILLDAPIGIMVDHINRNTLDNRKANLRLVTARGNALNRKTDKRNKSGHPGVYWDSARLRWRTLASLDGKLVNLGYFAELQHAIEARMRWDSKQGDPIKRDSLIESLKDIPVTLPAPRFSRIR